jgi:hypothetical protein
MSPELESRLRLLTERDVIEFDFSAHLSQAFGAGADGGGAADALRRPLATLGYGLRDHAYD